MISHVDDRSHVAGRSALHDSRDCVFGLRLLGMPVALGRFVGSPIATLLWRSRRAHVPGPRDGFVAEHGAHLEIGWGGYASYTIGFDTPAGNIDVVIDSVDEQEAAMAFVASGLPLALPMFGLEPLHGSAVQVGDRALLVLGDSGTGKSTLAGALDASGYALVADDACAIDRAGWLMPGPPFFNPRDDRLEQPVIGSYNNKLVRRPFGHATRPLQPLGTIVLDPCTGASLGLEPVTRREALMLVLANVRASTYLSERRRSLQLEVAASLAELPMRRLMFDPATSANDTVVDAAAMALSWAEAQTHAS